MGLVGREGLVVRLDCQNPNPFLIKVFLLTLPLAFGDLDVVPLPGGVLDHLRYLAPSSELQSPSHPRQTLTDYLLCVEVGNGAGKFGGAGVHKTLRS